MGARLSWCKKVRWARLRGNAGIDRSSSARLGSCTRGDERVQPRDEGVQATGRGRAISQSPPLICFLSNRSPSSPSVSLLFNGLSPGRSRRKKARRGYPAVWWARARPYPRKKRARSRRKKRARGRRAQRGYPDLVAWRATSPPPASSSSSSPRSRRRCLLCWLPTPSFRTCDVPDPVGRRKQQIQSHKLRRQRRTGRKGEERRAAVMGSQRQQSLSTGDGDEGFEGFLFSFFFLLFFFFSPIKPVIRNVYLFSFSCRLSTWLRNVYCYCVIYRFDLLFCEN